MINKLTALLPYIDKENLIEFYEERAAVREYNGNMTRERAEECAFHDTIGFFNVENHIKATTASAI